MDSKIYNIEFVKDVPSERDENKLYLQFQSMDTVGTTSGNKWVKVYGNGHEAQTALYKPEDPEEIYGAQAELISSHFCKLCLDGLKIRVPEINMVKDKGDLGLISYRVHDRTTEDFYHIQSLVLHNKYNEKQLSQLYSLGLSDILDSIRTEIHDDVNYKEIEKAIVMATCSDAMTNNADRHGKNWALVRNKDTNNYELAIFDNVKSFINLINNRIGYPDKELWATSYVAPESIAQARPSSGDKIINYIKKEYPEYFNEFLERFNSVRKSFCEDIKGINGVNDYRISEMFREKSKYFQKEKDMYLDF